MLAILLIMARTSRLSPSESVVLYRLISPTESELRPRKALPTSFAFRGREGFLFPGKNPPG